MQVSAVELLPGEMATAPQPGTRAKDPTLPARVVRLFGVKTVGKFVNYLKASPAVKIA